MKRRIETATSMTAKMTCMSRAASSLEVDEQYRSEDTIAPLLLPRFFKLLLHFTPIRSLFRRRVAPKGIYEYVIARTKYIDAVFAQALAEGFDQILIFGAGFDTRALRFHEQARNTKIFELDVPITQQAKIRQYQRRGLTVPANLIFIPIDFDRETLPGKLDQAGFCKWRRSLFVLEGLLMYLLPESVHATMQTVQAYAGEGSRVVFDTVYASVLHRDGLHYGESEIVETVSGADEQWHFGIERGMIAQFLAPYGLKVIDQSDASALEKAYFTAGDGTLVGRVNSTHCLVTAEPSALVL